MGKSNFDNTDILTFWGCIPVPEQRVLVNLAELAQTPAQTIGIGDIEAQMQFYGGLPEDKRTEVLIAMPGIATITDSNPLCGDEKGCVLFALSYYLGQIWAARLQGKCQIGAPVEPPCFYALTAPNI